VDNGTYRTTAEVFRQEDTAHPQLIDLYLSEIHLSEVPVTPPPKGGLVSNRLYILFLDQTPVTGHLKRKNLPKCDALHRK
jgi:hypothetical protein